MRVAYVTMGFPVPTETFASQDVRMLRERGVDIEVHALRTRHPETRTMLRQRGLTSLRVHHNGVWRSIVGVGRLVGRPLLAVRTVAWLLSRAGRSRAELFRSLALLPRAFDVLGFLEREPPHVVHIFWGHYPAIVGRLVQRTLPSVAVSISLNAYDLEMEFPCSADVAREADVVRTLASCNIEHVARFAGIEAGRVEVVYNGVDLKRLDALTASVSKRKRRLATAGRLTEHKGMFDVLETFARIRAQWPDATLVILGDGPARDDLKIRAEVLGVADGVEFEGHVSHDRVLQAAAEADVFLLLTKASGERLPNAVKEGMACRCVCVTTPTTGIDELIEHGSSGFVVPAGDPTAAAHVVGEVLSGHVDAQQIRARARRTIEERFDLERTTARYIDLWSRAARRRHSGARQERSSAASSAADRP